MNIQAENISVSINGRHILNGISCAAEAGKMTAITGKSGSGKTTLLNCLGLIQPIDSGRIIVEGKDASQWTENQKTFFWRKHAAFIYQDYGIIDDETIAYNVTLSNAKAKGARVQEVLQSVGLSNREKDLAVVLSGGEKQRLGIARSMFKEASIIYADEPTASLDAGNRENVISMLRQCAEAGALIILATHDDRLVKECDHVVNLSLA